MSRSTVVGGAAWMLGAKVAERCLGLVSTVVLARLLSPSDFGLVAMAMVFVAAADALAAFGLDWALIRQPALEKRHLDTAWTIKAGVGLFSFLLLAALSPLIADFYKEPRIQSMVIVLGLTLLIGSLENPGIVMFRRNMNFTKEFMVRTGSKIASAIIGIAAAIYLRSYWALLIGSFTGRAVATLMSYMMHSHRPRPTLSARQDLLSFSIWLWFSNILSFLRGRTVQLILGKVAGPRDLGLFSVASEFSQLAASELAAPINRALFSAYVTEGTSANAVAAAYTKATPVIWLFTLPIVVGAGLAAPQIIALALGPQWGQAAELLRILAVAEVFGLVSAGAAQIFWAINRARLNTTIDAAFILMLIGLLLWWVPLEGVRGAAYAVIVCNVVLSVLTASMLRKHAGISFRALLRHCWRMIVACALMLAVTHALTGQWIPTDTHSAFKQFGVIFSIAALTYGLTVYLLWRACGMPEGPESTLLKYSLGWLRKKRTA